MTYVVIWLPEAMTAYRRLRVGRGELPPGPSSGTVHSEYLAE